MRTMIALVTILLSISMLTIPARADQENIEAETERAAERALKQTESLATSIAFAFDYLATLLGETAPPSSVIQAELVATTERLDGVRSILVVGTDGTLLHDAFAYPAPQVNLANRAYVIEALEKPGMHFGEAVIGRTSGFPFAPISVHKPSLGAVFTAITDLRKLREALNWCFSSCGGAMLTLDGKLIAVSPPETTLDEALIQAIVNREETSGVFIHTGPNMSFSVAFRKSERFPFIILTSKALTPTANIATE